MSTYTPKCGDRVHIGNGSVLWEVEGMSLSARLLLIRANDRGLRKYLPRDQVDRLRLVTPTP